MTRLSAVTYLLLFTLLMAVSLRYTLRMRRKRVLVDGETLTDRFLIALPSLGIFLLPLAGFSLLATFLPLYLYRIGREERMLAARFGREWDDYRLRTRRLLPRRNHRARKLMHPDIQAFELNDVNLSPPSEQPSHPPSEP